MSSDSKPRLVEPLTAREQDVLALLVQGKTNREIAEELVLSINTVKWYNRQIYGKLGVEDREVLADRARELGLVDSDESPGQQRQIYNLPHPATPLLGREREPCCGQVFWQLGSASRRNPSSPTSTTI